MSKKPAFNACQNDWGLALDRSWQAAEFDPGDTDAYLHGVKPETNPIRGPSSGR